jgi:hypothetical protein
MMYAADNKDMVPQHERSGYWLWDMPRATADALVAAGARRDVFYCPSILASVKPYDPDVNWWDNSTTRRIIGYGWIGIRLVNGVPDPSPTEWPNDTKQFLTKFVGVTNATAMELIVDATLQNAANNSFSDVPSGMTKDGHHHNPHMDKNNPAGGTNFYLDGHAAWVKFVKFQKRYDPHDRVYWWW